MDYAVFYHKRALRKPARRNFLKKRAYPGNCSSRISPSVLSYIKDETPIYR